MSKYLLLFLFIASNLIAQVPDKEGSLVKWLTLEEAMKKQEVQPKPILLDFYTDWCGWCKTMMRTTYANTNLAGYVNNFFYPVKFNAEGKDSVEYLGEKYIPSSDKPRTPHPLAVKLLNNHLMYPTTLFLNGYDKTKNEFRLNMIASGYLEAIKLEPILIFIVENAGRNSTYDEFNKNYQKAFFDSTGIHQPAVINWILPDQAFNKMISENKKSFLFINSSWCTSCKVMKQTSFSDSSVSEYLSDKFNLIEFNAEITDTLIYKGQQYYNPKNPQMPFHQLAFLMGRNSITFPSLIVLDEKKEIIDVIPSYISPDFLNDISRFYGDNIYKSSSWADYIKRKKQPIQQGN